MNNDLISREVLLDAMCKTCTMQEVCEKSYNETRDFIQAIPAVDAEPVRHAAWTYKDDDVCYWWECNACGSGETMNTAYCPNCGAKMDLEEINDQK